MRVLLIGGGAREHAIGWKLAQSPSVDELMSLPGNPGLATLGPIIEGIAPTDVGAIAAAAKQLSVDLVVVGPEDPLAAGIVDAMARAGIRCFGPTRSAARLESSKAFAKEVMASAGVPTAASEVFTDLAAATTYLTQREGPYVVKADGLAAGKGVLVTTDLDAAVGWCERCLGGGFGAAGSSVLIEDYLDGPEVSVFAICSGTQLVPMQPARDYKRLLDGDAGPNTGGMGALSPVPELDKAFVDQVVSDVFQPVLAEMQARGTPYTGFLYAGLVLTTDGIRVLEFNCRLGDPETQVVLPLLETDLFEVIQAAMDDRLSEITLHWSTAAAVSVVLAADGYPEAPRKGDPISGLELSAGRSDVLVFHAGTKAGRDSVMSAGGRVVSVVGVGADTASARALAYDAVEKIRFSGKQFRTDIAKGAQ